jgi:hypothetical protein
MQDTLKNVGYGFIGLIIFIGIILLFCLFINGGLWLSAILYPWLFLISGIAFIICILVLLPLAIFRRTRGFSGVGFYIASYIFGSSLWVWSFLLAFILWGAMGLFIGLFLGGIGVVPIAALAVLFHGNWGVFVQLLFLIIFTFGTRALGYYLMEKS